MNYKIFLKGIFMGFCDLIPGISGGTIAFITGIYERLIKAISNLLKFKFTDIKFLFILFSGMFIAILLGSHLMHFLLEDYYVFTISFFIGLILASGLKIIQKNKINSKNDFIFLFLGLILGLLLIFIVPLDVVPNLFYIFFSGFLAISAMFLPGVSGSFILLILGVYSYMINVLKTISIVEIIVFILGSLIGAFFISKLVTYLFKINKKNVLLFLSGLVFGSLSVPIKMILQYNLLFVEIILIFILFLVGLFIIILIPDYN